MEKDLIAKGKLPVDSGSLHVWIPYLAHLMNRIDVE